MSIIKWKEFDNLLSIKDEVNSLIDKMFESTSFHSIEERYALISSGVSAPKFDVFYRGNDLVIQSNLPEFEKGDIKVSVSGNLLAIGSEVRRERVFNGKDAYRYQRSQGSFCKVMELPSGLDADRAKSTFTNGLLEVVIPKAGYVSAEQPKPVTNAIQAQEIPVKRETANTLPVSADVKP
jgi:HSP20 family protein